jgi:hypothetical protein
MGAATPTISNGPVIAQVRVVWLVCRLAAMVTNATLKMVKVMLTLSSPNSTLASNHHRDVATPAQTRGSANGSPGPAPSSGSSSAQPA